MKRGRLCWSETGWHACRGELRRQFAMSIQESMVLPEQQRPLRKAHASNACTGAASLNSTRTQH
eukprot:2438365-Rhodomonas_salina.2